MARPLALDLLPTKIRSRIVVVDERHPITLCGEMFGLGTTRHRLFELSFYAIPPRHVPHRGTNVDGTYVTVTGNRGVPSWTYKQRQKVGLPKYMPNEMSIETRRRAMGIDWMTNDALVQAIPPAYSHWVGARALSRTMP